MVAFLALTNLQVSSPVAWGDLLQCPASFWQARLGAAKRLRATDAGGFSLETYTFSRPSVIVTFIEGRPSKVEHFLPSHSVRNWRDALAQVGLPSTRAVMVRSDATRFGNRVLLRLPSLPKGVLVEFIRRRQGDQATEELVVASVAREVRMTPTTAERKAILDIVREAVRNQTGERVVFRVSQFRLGDGWAFVAAEPRTGQDKPANWKRLNPPGYEAGAYDPISFALLRLQGRKWSVKAMALGPTDVAWEPWPEQFNAPRGLFFP